MATPEDITQQFQYAFNAKEDIKDAINEKGVEVTDATPFGDYGNRVRQINTNTSPFEYSTGDDSAILKSTDSQDANEASGYHAVAVGTQTQAVGDNSFTAGGGTIASEDNQFVAGQYNETSNDDLLIIGNGTDDANRNNAFEVHTDGRATVGANPQNAMDVATKEFTEDSIDTVVDDIEDGSIVAGKALTSKQLENVSDESGSTQTTPFVFQATGTDNNTIETPTAPIAKHLELRGNTVVWNQLVMPVTNATGESPQGYPDYKLYRTNDGVSFYTDNAGNWIVDGTSTAPEGNASHAGVSSVSIPLISGHKYLIKGLYGDGGSYSNPQFCVAIAYGGPYVASDYGGGVIYTANGTGDSGIAIRVFSGVTVNMLRVTPQVFDLTKIPGAENEPSTVLQFNRDYPLPYYAYNAGALKSCQSNKLVTVKYNQLTLNRTAGEWAGQDVHLPSTPRDFDADKYYVGLAANNYYGPTNISSFQISDKAVSITTRNGYGVGFPIRVIPGYEYTLERSVSDTALDSARYWISWYDANGDYLGDNTRESSAQSGKNIVAPDSAYWGVIVLAPVDNVSTTFSDICFYFTWDGSRTGFEKYVKHEYTLPNVELRSAGPVYDEITPDGTYTQRIGSVDMGTLAWNKVAQYAENAYTARIPNKRELAPLSTLSALVCAEYSSINVDYQSSLSDRQILETPVNKNIIIKDDRYATAEDFTNAVDGQTLYYALETPITSTVQTFAENIEVDDFGTMEFVSGNTESASSPIVPQGNKFFYPADYVLLIDDLNSYVSGDVNQLVKQSQFSQKIPPAPTADGIYNLVCTVSSGVVTYTWEDQVAAINTRLQTLLGNGGNA